ncbi:testis-specific serine/threonine-protein kinase 6-like [Clavelina lepadiformis]|uniref:testis-specific serine/threonine-protein kinase 6-like n=1 Tax=Clavelina lepadiformis TaxID=159417 RepID=UPI0040434B6C
MSGDSIYLRKIGYLLGNRINSGSFSTIHNALQISKADVVAVKIIDMKNSCASFRTRFLPRELANIQSLFHPNIIKVRKIAKAQEKVYIVMDYARTNLRSQIELRTYIPEEQARKWFRQLASALDYLHRHGVAHRDIKIENILIDQDNNIKLCDFGFSKLIEKRRGQNDQHSTTFCGSLAYCAPEILLRTPYDPWKTDIWSLGVVLYKMVVGGMPFGEGNDLGSMKRITKAQTKVLEFPPFPKLSESCQELIKALLTVESDQRISMVDISRSKWVNTEDAKQPNKRRNKLSFYRDNFEISSTPFNGVIGRQIPVQSPSMMSRLRMHFPSMSLKNKRDQKYN